MGVWSWAGGHARAVKLGSLAAAVALLAGGLLLGMTVAAGSPAPTRLSPAPAAAELAKPSGHYIVGTVVEVFPAARRAIVRGRGGRFFVVEFDASTVVRRDRQRQPLNSVRRGTRVIILGEPRDGRLHADIVTITGTAPPRQVPAASPAPAATPTPSS